MRSRFDPHVAQANHRDSAAGRGSLGWIVVLLFPGSVHPFHPVTGGAARHTALAPAPGQLARQVADLQRIPAASVALRLRTQLG